MRPHFGWFIPWLLLLAGVFAQETYRLPPKAFVDIVDAPMTPAVVLSPDRQTLLFFARAELPTIAELVQPELRLAGLRLNPATNGPSRATTYTGLSLQPVAGGAARPVAGLPAGARIAYYSTARNSRQLALALVRDDRLELWLVDLPAAQARRPETPALNAVFGEPFVWLDDATLAVRVVPAGRGAPPAAPRVPTGPVVQDNAGRRAAARTYEDLLANAHDEALFEHYGTAELALVALDGKVTPLPVRGLIAAVSPSPDGRHLLVETIHRPYSYLVPYSRFPQAIDVFDRAGRRVHRVADLPLSEGTASGAVRPGPRSVTWRADQPATLSWVRSLASDREDAAAKNARRDGWFTFAAPFTGRPIEQQKFEYRVSGIQWGDDTLALVTESWTRTRRVRTWRVAPGRPGSAPELLFDRSSEDRYRDPGRPLTARNAAGRLVLLRSDDGTKLYLTGMGASPEGGRPFLDEFDLATKQARRLWRSEPPYYEEFVAFLDAARTRALTVRESVNTPPNHFVRDLGSGGLQPLTQFANPFPQFAGVKKELVRYTRADGVALSGTLYLPPRTGADKKPFPALVWAYPRDYLSADAAEQVTSSPHRFMRVSASGALPFVLAGYAVLDNPSMPIVARGEQKPNDTYIAQLVASAQAAADELVRRGADRDRIGVAGHSYGAFMTANLLAHSRLFRAGIARSGAYNRTLTPFGFQAEQRTLWQAAPVYQAMSPFNYADKVKDPLLLIHGTADNNSGTFPIQSERFFAALKGHGAITRLVMLPHESHGYRARESVLHVLWETQRWLDTHVKNAPPRATEQTPPAKKAVKEESTTCRSRGGMVPPPPSRPRRVGGPAHWPRCAGRVLARHRFPRIIALASD